MTKKAYDLEERTFLFAKSIRALVKNLPKSQSNTEDIKQVIRSSGSVGANYIEANESFSKKDFLFRVKISRKEAKETAYWLRLLLENNESQHEAEIRKCFNEVVELKKILSAIIGKSSN